MSTLGRVLEIDSRPSDAVALAVRTGARIMVAEEVLEVAQVIETDAEQEEHDKEKFRDLLEQVEFEDDLPDSEA